MLKVGLTGGYASGKSFVAAELRRHGCHIIYADQLGRQTLQPGGEAFSPVIDLFGRTILAPDGTIDRKKLASLAFTSPEVLSKLNALVHPAVFRLEENIIESIRNENPHAIIVIEAAILIETGHYKVLDRLILTVCSLETQIARGMKRDGASREEILARLENQLPLEDKKRFAHYVIDTSGTKEQTAIQVEKIFFELKQLAEATT